MLPQHLQHADRYHESLLHARSSAADPLAFGAVRVGLDAEALRAAEAQVVLTRFEGVLPDGTVLAIGTGQSAHPAPLPVPISVRNMPANGRPLPVYLALVRENDGGDNYGLSGEGAEGLRYSVTKTELADRAKNDRRDLVALAAPNTKLFLGEEAFLASSYDALKVAEVVHGPAGLSFSEAYIPPCLQISASPALLQRIQALRGRMMQRHSALSQRRRETDDGRVEYTSVDVTRYLQLQAINSMLPTMHYLGTAGDVAPRFCFLMLTQLVGQLATFSSDVDMKEPFPFDFENLQQTFERVLELAEELLQLTDQQHYVACPLRLSDGLFHASVQDPRLGGGRRYILAVKSPLDRATLTREVEQNAKIANAQFIKQLLRGAFGGVPASAIREDERDPARTLPVQVERQRGWVYFNIPLPNEYTSRAARWEDYWAGVWQTGELCLWLPEPLTAGMEIKLLRVLDARDG